MYYAIIDSMSDVSRLATVAYGVKLSDVAEWFVAELKDTYEMYNDGTTNEDDEKVLKQCEDLLDMAKADALEKIDLEGLSFAVCDISVELYGIYDTYEEFTSAFLEFVKDKPKYVKIKPETNPEYILAECDRLNALLVRASI